MNQTTILFPGSGAELRKDAQNQNLLEDVAASELRLGRDRLARSLGFPGIGTRLTNYHGMEWRVVGHTNAASPASVQSNGGQLVLDDPNDLMPIIEPEKLSPRLDTFFREVYHCTSKGFLFLDTVPHIRTNRAHPFGHSVYDTDIPNCITFMLDAVNINETVLAHELGHVWLRLVEDCEYDYHLIDISDPAKVRMVNYVQSFVLDRRVNEVIEERGFDVSCIRADQQESIVNFALAVSLGHQPPYRFESVFTALVIANQILDGQMPVESLGPEDSYSMQPMDPPHQILDLMAVLREGIPEIYELAEAIAGSVLRNGYRGQDAIARSIEECLQLAFGFAGIDFDVARDFHLVPFVEPMTDKFPEFLPGFPVAAKLEAGKAMAGKNLPWPLQYALQITPHGYTAIRFLDVQGQWTQPVVLHHVQRRPEFDLADIHVPRLPTVQNNPHNPYAHLPAHVRNMCGDRFRHAGSVSPPLRPNLPATVPGPFDHLPDQVRSMMPQLLKRNNITAFESTSLEQLVKARGRGSLPFGLPMPPSSRTYMAGEGRWLSQARLQEQLSGEHPYTYAGNNPVNQRDPSGLDYREAYDTVYSNAADIRAAASAYGIPVELLAGVIFNEVFAGGKPFLNYWNDRGSVLKFYAGKKASLGITQVQIDLNAVPECRGSNALSTQWARRTWLRRYLANTTEQIRNGARRLKGLQGNRPIPSGGLTAHEMSIILSEYNGTGLPPGTNPYNKAKPSPYGAQFLKYQTDITNALNGVSRPGILDPILNPVKDYGGALVKAAEDQIKGIYKAP